MLLDPEIAKWIERYPAPDVDPRDVAAVRAIYASYMADRGGPQPLQSHPDVRLTSGRIGGVDVLTWTPARPRGNRIVIAMHGGAFVVGHPLGAERIAMPLAAQHGITTVSVGYRLAPEHPAPAALEDCMTVLRDVAEGADSIAVHGSSAGACLAAASALCARDEGIPLALQSLSCPALDPFAMQPDRGGFAGPPGLTDDLEHSSHGPSPTLSRAAVVAMWEHYLGGRPDDASPSVAYAVPGLVDDLAGVAPAHVLLAEYDVLRDEGASYAMRLSLAGVPVTLERFGGTVHGFDGLMPDSFVGRRSIDSQVESLAKALRD